MILLWLAVWLQLADPKETEMTGALFMERLAALHDAPPTRDVNRLPPPLMAREMSHFADAHMAWLDQRWSMEPERYSPWLAEHRLYVTFWREIVWAHMDHIQVPSRRQSMKDAKRIIGERAWLDGDWPEPAPLWRFRESK